MAVYFFSLFRCLMSEYAVTDDSYAEVPNCKGRDRIVDPMTGMHRSLRKYRDRG